MNKDVVLGPEGKLAIRQIPSYADANLHGDVSGSWVVSLMDKAAEQLASHIARGRIANVAMETLVFTSPIRVNNTVSVYTRLLDIGTSSIRIGIEVWTQTAGEDQQRKVVDTKFVYVAIDETGRIREVPSELD